MKKEKNPLKGKRESHCIRYLATSYSPDSQREGWEGRRGKRKGTGGRGKDKIPTGLIHAERHKNPTY